MSVKRVRMHSFGDCNPQLKICDRKLVSIDTNYKTDRKFVGKRTWWQTIGWLRGTVGRTSVIGRRRPTYSVLRSTCSWRVTIYVDKPSAAGQPTRPTQPFILFGVDKLSSEQLYQMCAGSAIWWVLTRLSQVWFINHWAPFVVVVYRLTFCI